MHHHLKSFKVVVHLFSGFVLSDEKERAAIAEAMAALSFSSTHPAFTLLSVACLQKNRARCGR